MVEADEVTSTLMVTVSHLDEPSLDEAKYAKLDIVRRIMNKNSKDNIIQMDFQEMKNSYRVML